MQSFLEQSDTTVMPANTIPETYFFDSKYPAPGNTRADNMAAIIFPPGVIVIAPVPGFSFVFGGDMDIHTGLHAINLNFKGMVICLPDLLTGY